MPRKPWDPQRYGPRFPPPKTTECWHCTETRRQLTVYGITLKGAPFAWVRLCGPCATDLVHLDPDPRQVEAA